MKRRVIAILLAALVGLGLTTREARAGLDPSRAEVDVTAAMQDETYAFCGSPSRPLSEHARALCPLAGEIHSCAGFVAACAGEAQAKPPPDESPSPWKEILAKIARIAIWMLVIGSVLAIAYPIVRALRKERVAPEGPVGTPARLAQVTAAPLEEAVAAVDAETLLRTAGELAREGRNDAALFTYLAAALRALDQRGAIRIARHKTHGEYVRGCTDPASRPPLRDLVREVDGVKFGGKHASADAVVLAASRAVTVVRAPTAGAGARGVIATMLLFVLAVTACDGGAPGNPNANPAGNGLVLDLLHRQGVSASYLAGSLATLPREGKAGPAVIIDLERTKLEDETKDELVAWVRQGGSLVLVGAVEEWPHEAQVEPTGAKGRGVTTYTRVATPSKESDEGEADPETRFDHGKLARASALQWVKASNVLGVTTPFDTARLEGGEYYACFIGMGEGHVLGVANDDLFTNAGVVANGNAAVLVALLSYLDKSAFVVARAEDGVSPPSNPVAGLARAGLGLGMAHALAFALVLFLAVGARQSRPKPTEPPRRRAFAEHVEATGALYARTKLAGHALAAYARYADERLRAKMPRGSDPAAFLALRSGVTAEECAAIYARAMAARTEAPKRGDELETLRRLSALYASAMRAE